MIIKRLVHSRIGRAMIALEGERVPRDFGRHRCDPLSRAGGGGVGGDGGRGGSLYAHYVKIIDPDIFLFIYTVTMVIMVITGGKGTLAGPIVGGLIFGFLPVILRAFGRACGAMDPLRRADDRHRIRSAAGDRAGGGALGGELEAAAAPDAPRAGQSKCATSDGAGGTSFSRSSTWPCISAGSSPSPT